MPEPFIADRRSITAARPPFKVYLSSSYRAAFGPEDAIGRAFSYAVRAMAVRPSFDERAHAVRFVFPYATADGHPAQAVDVFGLRLLTDDWRGNAMYDGFTREGNVFVPKEKGVTCGATLQILAREDALRRETRSVEEYLERWPDIADL